MACSDQISYTKSDLFECKKAIGVKSGMTCSVTFLNTVLPSKLYEEKDIEKLFG